MPDVTIVYWRDIPAQVIVGKGRRGAKVQLPERFEQAIDRAAMKVGIGRVRRLHGRIPQGRAVRGRGRPGRRSRTAEAARIDAEFDTERLKALIANDGWA